jgi:diguanylate cyclase (GGDEF)-like protein
MTILIVDNDPVGLPEAQRMLEEMGETAVAVRDGRAAWDLLQARSSVRIVVACPATPNLEGVELCRWIRTLTDRPSIYFLLATSRHFDDRRREALAAGVDDFLSYPFDRAELTARIKVARRVLAAEDDVRRRTDELDRVQRQLERRNEQLTELAASDGLTGLRNYRHFRETREEYVATAERQGHPLSLVMLDVDWFKQYNDAFGHPAGDEVLASVARVLRESVRDHDQVARYGGEEFALLLPRVGVEASLIVGERIRSAIAGFAWQLRPVTASVGVATTGPTTRTADGLLECADRALYVSKARGRDRVTHIDSVAANKPPAPDAKPLPTSTS